MSDFVDKIYEGVLIGFEIKFFFSRCTIFLQETFFADTRPYVAKEVCSVSREVLHVNES